MGNQQPLNGNAASDDPRRQQQVLGAGSSTGYGGAAPGGYPMPPGPGGGGPGGAYGGGGGHHHGGGGGYGGRGSAGGDHDGGGGGGGRDRHGGGGGHSGGGVMAAAQQAAADAIARTGSDASMTILDGSQTAAAVAAAGGGAGGNNAGGGGNNATTSQVNIENFLNDDTVPTVFRWEHGGRQVYITGTFNGWSRQIPMHRSGNDFTYIHNLKRGKHAFKFIVDDEWRFAPDQPTVADIEGRINNFIDVTDFKAYTGDREFEKEKAAAEYGLVPGEHDQTKEDAKHHQDGTSAGEPGSATATATADGTGTGEDGPGGTGAGGTGGTGTGSGKPDRDGEIFSNTMPDVDDYTKEPPPLPPHLRHIILNKPPQLQDTAALPVPQHVALNHLYCTAIKDNMMVLGITQRFKTKFVTTVYYSPCASK